MSLLHAQFDPAALGTGLALEQSNTVLTYTGALSLARTARSTIGKSRGVWSAEWLVWGDASIANAVSVGLVQASASLSTYVGGDAFGIGYRPGEGEIHVDGTSIESVATAEKNQSIGLLLDCGDWTATWAVDGEPLVTVEIDPGEWFLAASIAGATGFDLRILQITGDRPMEFPFAAGRGWFRRRPSAGIIRLADKPFITRGIDDMPNAVYRGLLLDRSSLSLRGPLDFWPLREGNSGSGGASSGTLQVDNATGRMDALITQDIRDANVRLLRIPEGGTYADRQVVGAMLVDSVGAEDDGAIEIRLGDPLDQLDAALQARLAGPHVEPTAASTTYPLTIGVARSVEPLLLSWSGYPAPTTPEPMAAVYALHDGPVPGLGTVADGGYPLDPAADPPDYYLDARGRLVLRADPFYRLTADLSSIGGGAPGAAVDLLDGAGAFDDAGDWDLNDAIVSGGQLILQDNYTGASDRVEGWAAATAMTLLADKVYRIEITIAEISGYFGFTGQRPRVILTRNTSGGAPNKAAAIWSKEEAGVYTAILPPRPFDSLLYVALVGTQSNADQARIQDMRVFEVYSDPVDDESLECATLEETLRIVIEDRAEWASERWQSASAAAIDTATSYAGVGLHVRSAATMRAELQRVLDSYCACLYRGRDGVVRVARMRRPAEGEAIGTITFAQMAGALRPIPYTAPGLTTEALARKNYSPLVEGQMSSDTVDVPLSVRARLMASHRISVSSAANLSRSFDHAKRAKPIEFAFDKRADAQAEIDYVCGMHEEPMTYYLVPVIPSLDYERNQVWMVSYEPPGEDGAPFARYSLGGAGKPMLVIDVDEDPLQQTCTLLCLG